MRWTFFTASSPRHAVEQRRQQAAERMEILVGRLSPPSRRPFWLFGIDTTSGLRPFASRLLENLFRFGTNHLLLDRYQTPDVEHEETWWETDRGLERPLDHMVSQMRSTLDVSSSAII